jgi:hypothetical protein
MTFQLIHDMISCKRTFSLYHIMKQRRKVIIWLPWEQSLISPRVENKALPFLVQSFFRKFALLLWGWKFTSARDHKQMLTFRGVQFVDCISKINYIFQYFGVFCFLKTQKTLHPYWIIDLRHIPSNIYLIEVLSPPHTRATNSAAKLAHLGVERRTWTVDRGRRSIL